MEPQGTCESGARWWRKGSEPPAGRCRVRFQRCHEAFPLLAPQTWSAPEALLTAGESLA
jgi:hypothetical protein